MDITSFALLIVGIMLGATGAVLAARGMVASLRTERDRVQTERDTLHGQLRFSESAAAGLRAQLEAELARAARAEQDTTRLTEQFDALAARALRQNNEQFLAVAEQRLKQSQEAQESELHKRERAVEAMVEPLGKALAEVRRELTDSEKARAEAHSALREQVTAMGLTSEQLRQETSQLVSALRAPQVRGRWGEMQLRRVVESAGMLEHCDFVEQASVTTPDGVLRPDLVVKLAGDKNVVVDAKVAFSGYLEAMEARDDATRTERLKAHARHLRAHIDQLGAKAYWQHFDPTPEFVVMFVPAEVFLNAALEQDPTLLEHAFSKDVVIATPATLVALLRTVAYTWRTEALAKNAADVFTVGKQLHGRLATMGNHVAKLGRSLNGAVEAYNSTVSSFESRVLVSARRLSELQVTDTELPTPAQLELRAVAVQAAELVASDTDALVHVDAAAV